MVDLANTWVFRGGHINAVLVLRICHHQVVFYKTDVSLTLSVEYVKIYKRKYHTMHKATVFHFIFQNGKIHEKK